MEKSIEEHFGRLTDPRIIGRCTYPLKEMLLVALTSIICGGKGYQDMADFGEDHLDFLKTIYPFENGTPKRDTFRDLFLLIDHKEFEEYFFNWARSISDKPGDTIAIDGKCLRGSGKGLNLVNMVSAWCHENSTILGQVAVTNKSNEIEAIPKLLKFLDLKNKVITLDAMGCQRAIAEQIVEQKGDYVYSLKGNQGSLHQDVREFLEAHESRGYQDGVFHFEEKLEKGHGRTEIRKYTFTATLDYQLETFHKWPGLKGVGKVESTRIVNKKESREVRYFITSLENDGNRFVRAIRNHWGIENKVHWTLDVCMDEDACRVRKGNGPKNLSIIRRYALNLIRKHADPKRSIRRNMNKIRAKYELLRKLIID